MDRYQRLKKIGEGAFGKAVLIRHKQTNRQCVVKEINIMKMAAKEREDARKEVAVLGQLKHPNIVTYIESFEEAGTLFIVMNYCSGGDLYAKINSQRGRLFTEEQVLNWFVQICLALKHIHDRKILHRDIKSQNIFLTSAGTVQLGDFGIAKVLNNTVELARTCIGTPYYLSPEIVENKPYNNKSDIWSLGCVLYELTTLKHAFEAGNMKNLVLKIIRGSYPPIPPQYSYDLRGLVAQLFKRAPRDRPSINSILKKNFVMERVRRLLSAEEMADEFSHTVMHGAKIAKALPPAPRPSSAPKRAAGNPPRPGSAGRGRYNPANVYGVPLGRKSQNRSSGDLKKKGGSGGGAGGVNRPVPIPGQQDWERRKKEMIDREQKRREYEEQAARRHQNLVEKQKMDRINKARENGWKQLIGSSEEKESARPQTPVGGGGVARPLPMPRQQAEPVQPNFQLNRAPREAGNYDHYLAYLDKLKMDRQEKAKEMNPRGQADYMPAPRPLPNNPDNPPAVQAAQAINQANYDRKMAGQAAERARIVEDYVQRRQAAAANKARGLADLHGGRPPSGRGRRTPEPVQRPGAARKPVAAVRNKEEQEYLEHLRQIREQNMRERRNLLQQRAGIPSPVDAEERKKKADALKQQAEDWAKKKKDQLEKEKEKLLKQPQDRMKQQQGSRPNSARANMTPAPAVPVSGILHLIGANKKAASPGGQEEVSSAEEESPANLQQKKSDILKNLNNKTPGRGKWGSDKEPVILSAETATEEEEDVKLRRPWGGGGVSPLAEPESARSQWGEEQLRLSDLPLEQTGSAMEATSARDQVVKNPGSARNQWGRPGSTLVKALNQLPISEGTVTLDSENQQENKEMVKPPVTTLPAVGYTISLSDSPAPTPAPTPTPASQPTPVLSVKPPIRSGTIVLSSSESKLPAESPSEPTSTAPAASSAASLGVVGGKDQAESSPQLDCDASQPLLDQPQHSHDASLSLSGEQELPGSNRFFKSDDDEIKILSGCHRLSTVLEGSKDFSENGVDEKTASMAVSEKSSSKPQTPPKSDGNEDGSEKKNVDLTDGGKPEVPEKPAVKPKPMLKPKPVVAEKPVLLPKPTLLSKPDQPYQFSEETPVVVASSESSQVVFNKPRETAAASAIPASPAATLSAKGKLNTAERSDSVQKGLFTGNFDMKNVQMLRTCSEPDLTHLFRELDKQLQTKSTLTRHQSLDLTPENELQDDSSPSQDESPDSSNTEEEEKQSNSVLVEDEDEKEDDNEDKEDEAYEEDDDEDEDLKSLQETMQSLLLDNDDDDDEEEGALSPKIKFSMSSDVETTLKKAKSKDSEDKAGKEGDSSDNQEDSDNDDNKEDESANQTVREKHKAEEGEQKESGAAGEEENEEEESGVVGEDGDDEEDDEERLLYDTADILTLRDSDEETVFGDDDDDLDLFSRLEQQREQLESELGFEKFIDIYKTVQALQEDEDENIEEGARIAIGMLGADKQHLYPRIFQLVMADTAFTEDNA